ncbi:MAG: hypothetical protein IJD06_00095 [Clostridia bacterium]|nr:hypothetical protein [Clostridia bacterium]
METKRNLKYFTSKGVSPLTIVAIVLLVAGLVCCAMGRFMMMTGIILIVVAIGVMIFAGSGKASGDDIEYQVGEKMRDMHEYGMKRFELFEKSLKFLQPQTIRGYEFNDEVYYKKGSDGKNRTSVYNAAILFFTGDKMHIHHKRFSFVDDTVDEELGGTYRYVDLDHAEVRDPMFERDLGKRIVKFRDYHFVLVGKDGKDVLDMSVEYGADIDKLCDDMNRIIEIRTKAFEEKMARVEADRKARKEAEAAAAAQN